MMVGVAVLCKLMCAVGLYLLALQAHLCGMMSDLPDHVSTEQEITDTIVQLQSWLEKLPHSPVMVTIAR